MMCRNIGLVLGLVAAVGASSCGSCDSESSLAQSGDAARGTTSDSGSAAAETAETPSSKVLLAAQSSFSRNEKGRYTVPEAAKLLILRKQGARWTSDEIVDSESNVFHKGMILAEEGSEPAIVTIGGEKAALKLWRRGDDGWEAETLWQPDFGGETNRLRDMEIADVTGDGQPEIVVATHDQGIVAVVQRTDEGWEPTELGREAGIWVHEVETGDVDGDGTAEIYFTPSHPNKGTGGAQPGKIGRFRWTGEQFERDEVVSWANRHAKEVMVTDLSGDGRPEVYTALEAETEAGSGLGGKLIRPVDLLRITRGDDGWTSDTVGTIEGERFCRFLIGGDLDGDDSAELLAASMTKGIWMFEPGVSAPFEGRLLTGDTGGFEHAVLLADYDGDGNQELFVADDTHGRLVRYSWADGELSDPEVLDSRTIPPSAITWNLWVAELPPAND